MRSTILLSGIDYLIGKFENNLSIFGILLKSFINYVN